MKRNSRPERSARAAGISYEDLCVGLVATAALDTPAAAVQGVAST